MKLKITILLVLFFAVNLVSAQQMVWASFEKFAGANTYCNVVSENENGLIMVRYKDKNLKKNIFIDYYNHGLRLLNTVGVADKKKQLEKVIYLEDKLYCIYKYFNYNSIELFYRPINYLQVDDKTAVLPWFTINTENGRIFNLSTDYNFSRTKAGLSFLSENKASSTFNINYFNADLQVSSTLQYQIPFIAKYIEIKDRIIDKNGNFYLIYTTEKSGFFSNTTCIYNLLTYNIKEQKWNNEVLNNEDFFISAIMLKEDIQNNRMICSYFYSPNFINGNYGFGNLAINTQTLEMGLNRKVIIEEEFARTITGNKANTGKELNSFIIQDIVPTADSGFIVVAERFFITDQNETFYQNGLPVTTSRNVYNFEEVMLYSFNKAGFVNWNKLLLKRQNSINDGGYFSSVIVIPAPEKLYIIFNEKLVYNGDVIQYTIDSDGKASQRNLFRRDMSSYMVIPTESRLIGYNRAAIPTILSNGERGLLKIIY